MSSKRNHGWVIQVRKDKPLGPWYYGGSTSYGGPLSRAFLFPTRSLAKYLRGTKETVRKVSLDKDGRPIEIIKGR